MNGKHPEPLTLDDLEIRGELLVPSAVLIVAGPADDAAAAATVLDYLAILGPAAPDPVGRVLTLGGAP